MKIIMWIIVLLVLTACASQVYTKTRFCIVCWDQITDTATNPHDEDGNVIRAKLTIQPINGSASSPAKEK